MWEFKQHLTHFPAQTPLPLLPPPLSLQVDLCQGKLCALKHFKGLFQSSCFAAAQRVYVCSVNILHGTGLVLLNTESLCPEQQNY